MNNNFLLLAIQFIIIILVLLIFFFVTKECIHNMMNDQNKTNEKFTNMGYKPANTRILYRNTSELPWNRHTISSSIPFDVTVKKEADKAYYYEFDNKTYEKKLRQIFNSNCEELIIAVEGTHWSKWLNPKNIRSESDVKRMLKYYNNVFEVINNKLDNKIMDLPGYGNKKKIQIVHDILLRYRYNKDNSTYCMFDIEMILYREGKLQGKHVKLIAITNGIVVNIIMVKIVGVISEDNIVLYPYVGNDSMNDMDFDIFIPEGNVMDEIKKMSNTDKVLKDDALYSDVEVLMYQKLLRDYNTEDEDIKNSIYTPKKEELVKRNTCST